MKTHRENALIVLTGANKSFHATWDATKQRYSIYKDNKFLKYTYSAKDVKNYVD